MGLRVIELQRHTLSGEQAAEMALLLLDKAVTAPSD